MARKKDSNERSGSRRRGQREDSSDSDSAVNEVGSSAGSNQSTPPEEGPSTSTGEHKENGHQFSAVEEEQSEVDDFEQKLELVLDQLQSAKSTRQRVQLFESLAKALTTRFCYDYFDNRRVTIQDILEHSLKRLDDETSSAAHTLTLLLITMGSSDFGEDIFRELFDQLNRILMDHGAKPAVRAKCATALSLGCFITDHGLEKTRPLLTELLSIAFTSVKGHSDQNYLNALFGLKAICLNMFSFLVSIESNVFTVECLNENIAKLTACLESPGLALRIAAGECIALLMEKCRIMDADYQLDDLDTICDKLQSLATDSQKSKSKKELREQRFNFRQILRTVQGEDEFGEETIKIGQERVVIECWQSKRYYDTFCSVLGSGMNLHLTQNVLLRDIFGLGEVMLTPPIASNQRISKLEKQYINNANRKAREMHRNKLRRKRAEVDL